MREALFIKRNAEKWESYQNEPSNDPDVQAERFITLLDDLAYSRTFYPQSKVTRWINGIATGIYQKIYRNKKEKFAKLWSFWLTDLPLVLYKHRRTLAFTTIFFVSCVAIGAISSARDDGFVKGILGDDYVAMTEENITKGDPFGVYRDDDKFTMFVRIAFNNIRVAFQAFLSGIVFCVGTLFVLFFNGVMIGAFEHMFFAKGLGLQSLLVIWMHGIIEISAIVIAGASGLILGSGWLFPGTYSRFQSFKIAVKDAVKIVICLVPFFVLAAFLESYVTYLVSNTFSNTDAVGLPIWLTVVMLLLSLWLIGWYFVWNPRVVARRQGLTSAHSPFISTKPV
ncbi:MAG: stage II sporulation protein M [Bacteroidetes bacterium]|nr:MAG: stage II sporulation protein M [Bacteroidota bacterium]